jgi:tetratricopeptide (TPR) repeat protein
VKKLNFIGISIVYFTLFWGTDRALGTARILHHEAESLSFRSQVEPGKSDLDLDLETRAQYFYETGQFAKAIEILEQAIANYAQQDDIYLQALAFRNLALVDLELGQIEPAQEALNRALDLIQSRENDAQKTQVLAQVLEVQGKLQMATGDAEAALETWKKATNLYQEIDEFVGATGNKINQAAALRALGLYDRASKLLQELQQTLQQQPDTLLKARVLHSLGDVWRGVGKLEESEAVLQQSLAILEAEGPEAPATNDAIASIFLSLGKTAQYNLSDRATAKEIQTSLNYYQRAAIATSSPQLQVQAQLNQLSLLASQKQIDAALTLVPKIQSQLEQLPPHRNALYARINFARQLIQLSQDNIPSIISPSQIAHRSLRFGDVGNALRRTTALGGGENRNRTRVISGANDRCARYCLSMGMAVRENFTGPRRTRKRDRGLFSFRKSLKSPSQRLSSDEF